MKKYEKVWKKQNEIEQQTWPRSEIEAKEQSLCVTHMNHGIY